MASGARLNKEEGLRLINGRDILRLGRLADMVRRRLHPRPEVTYTVTCNINYSNVCVCGCKFCAFYRPEGHPEAYRLTDDEILCKIEKATREGGVRILLQGGLHPRLGVDYFENLFRKIKERFQIHIHALSPPEIIHLSKLSGLETKEVLRRLQTAGLDSIPGGGAEILSGRTREKLSPEKCSAAAWLSVMQQAHESGVPGSATMMFGHMESKEEIIEHLLRLRELQDKTRGFTAFIPWTYQPGNTALAAAPQGIETVFAFEYLRIIAVSRIILDNVTHVQASLLTQGPKITQLALYFGADDLGDILVEEHVLHSTGLRQNLSRAEAEKLIVEAGRTPRLRDTLFRPAETKC